jgi:phosphoenolpyruvate-protein kinase (PTS system EI component)
MRISTWVLSAALIATGAALAKLPAPTPEEQAAAAEKKKKAAVQVEQEKQALERAMDRVAERYRSEKGSRSGTSATPDKDDMPKTTKELPGGVGPEPGQPTTGEAHSEQVK